MSRLKQKPAFQEIEYTELTNPYFLTNEQIANEQIANARLRTAQTAQTKKKVPPPPLPPRIATRTATRNVPPPLPPRTATRTATRNVPLQQPPPPRTALATKATTNFEYLENLASARDMLRPVHEKKKPRPPVREKPAWLRSSTLARTTRFDNIVPNNKRYPSRGPVYHLVNPNSNNGSSNNGSLNQIFNYKINSEGNRYRNTIGETKHRNLKLQKKTITTAKPRPIALVRGSRGSNARNNPYGSTTLM
jgi:hypothetical protein